MMAFRLLRIDAPKEARNEALTHIYQRLESCCSALNLSLSGQALNYAFRESLDYYFLGLREDMDESGVSISAAEVVASHVDECLAEVAKALKEAANEDDED